MSSPPILVIQMQRMGDLVLSFPLLSLLHHAYPGHPIWVVGEPSFYEPLIPLSPSVTYFSHASAKNFFTTPFHAVINLSHRPEAARLAGSVKSNETFGMCLYSDGRYEIRGDWSLYRASLTQNNRFNLFHWSDLFGLGVIPHDIQKKTLQPQVKLFPDTYKGARVGLFLGASEKNKRPDAPFWITLTNTLINAGLKPVLLGGPNEEPLANEVIQKVHEDYINLCNRFSIKELSLFLKTLDLLVTPDTGPMHVGAWVGTPILNLSIGSVNPFETGPSSAGHHIYRPLVECSGCWECSQPKVYCKRALNPKSVAHTVFTLLGKSTPFTQRGETALFMQTGRDKNGLFTASFLNKQSLCSLEQNTPSLCMYYYNEHKAAIVYGESFAFQHMISLLWKAVFFYILAKKEKENIGEVWRCIQEIYPSLSLSLLRVLSHFLASISSAIRGSKNLQEKNYWIEFPLFFRPLSGFCHMYLQNSNYSLASIRHILWIAEEILEAMKRV